MSMKEFHHGCEKEIAWAGFAVLDSQQQKVSSRYLTTGQQIDDFLHIHASAVHKAEAEGVVPAPARYMRATILQLTLGRPP